MVWVKARCAVLTARVSYVPEKKEPATYAVKPMPFTLENLSMADCEGVAIHVWKGPVDTSREIRVWSDTSGRSSVWKEPSGRSKKIVNMERTSRRNKGSK